MKTIIFGAASILALSMALQAQIYQTPTGDSTKGTQAQAASTNNVNEPSGAQTSGAATAGTTAQTGQASEVKTTFYLGPKLNELPQAVQDTIKREAKGQPLDDVDREIWNNQVVYEVEFKQAGIDRKIHIAENGSLMTINEAAGAPFARTNRLDLYTPVFP